MIGGAAFKAGIDLPGSCAFPRRGGRGGVVNSIAFQDNSGISLDGGVGKRQGVDFKIRAVRRGRRPQMKRPGGVTGLGSGQRRGAQRVGGTHRGEAGIGRKPDGNGAAGAARHEGHRAGASQVDLAAGHDIGEDLMGGEGGGAAIGRGQRAARC